MSYFNHRTPASEHVYADMVIWQCEKCNCWSKPEFVSDDKTCPVCKVPMKEDTKNIRVQ